MTMDERRESGFINSQPCIAEFMTSLPLINETLQPPSITTEGNSRSYCQQFTPNHPSLSQHADPRGPGIVDPRGRDSGTGKYPEFAWMKEKKNIRKNSNSSVPVSTGSDIGNYTKFFISLEFTRFNFNKLEMSMTFSMKSDSLTREGYLIRHKTLGVGVDFDPWFASERRPLFSSDTPQIGTY